MRPLSPSTLARMANPKCARTSTASAAWSTTQVSSVLSQPPDQPVNTVPAGLTAEAVSTTCVPATYALLDDVQSTPQPTPDGSLETAPMMSLRTVRVRSGENVATISRGFRTFSMMYRP